MDIFKDKSGKYWNLKMDESDDPIVVNFNFREPLSKESTGRDGSPYTWWLFNINYDDKDIGFFIYRRDMAERLINKIESYIGEDDNIKDFKWILTRTREKNPRTGRMFTGWNIEPYAEEKLNDISQSKDLDRLDELLNDPEFDYNDPYNLELSDKEIGLLNREKLFTGAYGDETIKSYLYNAGIPEDRADVLVDVLVDGEGNVVKDLVEKYGGL